jgi:hypothetical protein
MYETCCVVLLLYTHKTYDQIELGLIGTMGVIEILQWVRVRC